MSCWWCVGGGGLVVLLSPAAAACLHGTATAIADVRTARGGTVHTMSVAEAYREAADGL